MEPGRCALRVPRCHRGGCRGEVRGSPPSPRQLVAFRDASRQLVALCGRPRRPSMMACIVCESQDLESKLPCCGAAVCTACLRSTAAASGCFFRCPSCRSDHECFFSHAAALGVELHQKAPEWMDHEDPNMIMQRICALGPRCKAPRGPGMDSAGFVATRGVGDQPEWRLIACASCGQSAIHPGCARSLGATWQCDDCACAGGSREKTIVSEVGALRVGDVVEARWNGGSRWFPGHVRKIDTRTATTRWLIAFSDGDTEWIDRQIRIRRPTQAGEEPAAKKSTGSRYRGWHDFMEEQKPSILEELATELTSDGLKQLEDNKERYYMVKRKASERWHALTEEERNSWRAAAAEEVDEEDAVVFVRRTLPPRKATDICRPTRRCTETGRQRVKVEPDVGDEEAVCARRTTPPRKVKSEPDVGDEPGAKAGSGKLSVLRVHDRDAMLAKMEDDGWLFEARPRKCLNSRGVLHIDHYYFSPAGQEHNSMVSVAREHYPEHIINYQKEPSKPGLKTRSMAKTAEERPAATPEPVAKKRKVAEAKSTAEKPAAARTKADRQRLLDLEGKTEEKLAAARAKADADRQRLDEFEGKTEAELRVARATAEADQQRLLDLEVRVRVLEAQNTKLREDVVAEPDHDQALRSAVRDRDALWEVALARADCESRLFARLANLEASWKPTPRPPAPTL